MIFVFLIQKLVAKTQNVALLIECGGIWFANGKFGVTWKLVQAIVKPRQSLAGKCHIELSCEEREVLNEQESDNEDAVVANNGGENTGVNRKIEDAYAEEYDDAEGEVHVRIHTSLLEMQISALDCLGKILVHCFRAAMPLLQNNKEKSTFIKSCIAIESIVTNATTRRVLAREPA